MVVDSSPLRKLPVKIQEFVKIFVGDYLALSNSTVPVHRLLGYVYNYNVHRKLSYLWTHDLYGPVML
jgi:hypothetical protein